MNLAILSSYIRKFGYEAKIFDSPLQRNFEEIINSFNPDIIGIGGVTRTILHGYKLADFSRKNNIFTIIGGVHASILPEEAIEHADAVIKGEGEKALLDVIRNRSRGIVEGECIMNLDEIPIPSFDLLDMNYYSTTHTRNFISLASYCPHNIKVGYLISSRGCPFRCIYCYNSYNPYKIRYHSPERVIEEMRLLKDKYNIGSICFLDDNMLINQRRLKEICLKIIREKIDLTWACNARVDNINDAILKILAKAGCVQLAFGFESGSPRILDILNKKTIITSAINAINKCNENNIIVSGNFMIGNPTETEEDLQMSINFASSYEIDGGLGLSITIPFPGTKLWVDYVQDYFKIKDLDWNSFDYINCPVSISNFSRETLLQKFNQIRSLFNMLFIARKISREKKYLKIEGTRINR